MEDIRKQGSGIEKYVELVLEQLKLPWSYEKYEIHDGWVLFGNDNLAIRVILTPVVARFYSTSLVPNASHVFSGGNIHLGDHVLSWVVGQLLIPGTVCIINEDGFITIDRVK